MIETITTIGITASSVFLFAYWFRYTCLLILSAKTTRDYASDVARANQLSFIDVQVQLRERAAKELGDLQKALDRDYALVTHLLKQGSVRESVLEERMLAINYRLMRAWYKVNRRFSPVVARRTLCDMALVVAHFANAIGERAACASAA